MTDTEHKANIEMVADFIGENLFAKDLTKLEQAKSKLKPKGKKYSLKKHLEGCFFYLMSEKRDIIGAIISSRGDNNEGVFRACLGCG